MDNLSEKISSLLSDPAALDQIRNMAEGLFADNKTPAEPQINPAEEAPLNFDFGKMLSVMGKLKSTATDERSKLLLALKPHLSPKRQERADKAVKILRLLDLLPLLKESGFLNFL
ncbi:MAG: hypothetical protein IJP26_05955 [Clostridia bacterium]|nr:hypothetical protein [Clostridia bacterium]